jgi:hypothetical protein
MLYGFLGEDEAGKDGDAGNVELLSMEPDAASRRHSRTTCGRSILRCDHGGTLGINSPKSQSTISVDARRTS